MNSWQDHLNCISVRAASEQEVLDKITSAARLLGFEICAESLSARSNVLLHIAQAFGLSSSTTPHADPESGRRENTLLRIGRLFRRNGRLDQREIRESWFACVALLALAREITVRHPQERLSPLTEREREVLRRAAEGKTSAEISRLLSVSEHTVNFHIRNAVVKLDAPNKTCAVVRATRLGWL